MFQNGALRRGLPLLHLLVLSLLHGTHLLEDLGVLEVERQLSASEETETHAVDETEGGGLLEAEGEEGDKDDEERLAWG